MDKTQQDYSALCDNDLLLQIKNEDDQKAFAVLMERYKDRIRALSYRLLYTQQGAEDATQDVFCTVWKNRDKWDVKGKAQFSTWIYRVTVNRCVDIKRRQRPQVNIDDVDLVHDAQGSDLDIEQQEIRRTLQTLLDDLPVNQALALRLYYFEEKTIPEISKQMDKSDVSVRSMIKRGKASLRNHAGDHQEMLKGFC